MIVKEEDKMIDFVPVQTGDQIKKADKNGQVIEVNDDGALVMWKDGKMSLEDPMKLDKKENDIYTEYLRKGRLL